MGDGHMACMDVHPGFQAHLKNCFVIEKETKSPRDRQPEVGASGTVSSKLMALKIKILCVHRQQEGRDFVFEVAARAV
jgi:hypothetical protein